MFCFGNDDEKKKHQSCDHIEQFIIYDLSTGQRDICGKGGNREEGRKDKGD